MDLNQQLDNFLATFSSGGLQTILKVLIIFFIGWLIARALKSLVVNLLKRTNWDERLIGDETGKEANSFFGNIIYYIVMLFTLLLVLEAIGMKEALGPLNEMTTEFTNAIPNVVFAGIIGFVGYTLAKIVSTLITLGGAALDNWVDKTGFKDTNQVVNIIQKVVFAVIFIPFLIQALATLNMDAISGPATNLLQDFMAMLGDILVAAAVVFLFVWGGKFVTNFLQDLFAGLKFDELGAKIGLENMIGDQSISKLIANLIYFFIVFFGVITAVDILGLDKLSGILNELLYITGQILFGLVILVVGNYISTLIYNAMTRSSNNQFIANVVRWASLALFIAIALRQMGIANEIVELAFGAIVLALAVVVALAYGLGGREAAGEHFKEIINKFRNNG